MTPQNRMLIPRVGVAAVCSPLEVGADRAPQAAEQLASRLKEVGCEVVPLGPAGTPDEAAAAGRKAAESHVQAVALVAVSWFEDYLALDLYEEAPLPLLLWALPGMETGALCGVQQLAYHLKQLGAVYHCEYGPLESQNQLIRGGQFLQAAALKHRLRRARVGQAGQRVDGMTDASTNELAMKKIVGPRIVAIDLPQLLKQAGEMPDDPARQKWAELVQCAGSCGVPESDGLDSMKVYAAIREVVEQQQLDALTIGCYPHLMGRVCLPASLLADEGIPLGCEGDVNAAVAQLMLTLLTGQPTHNTDWLEPLEDGTVIFSHCGCGSFSLSEKPEKIELKPVRLMDRGVNALFPSKPGPVTLLNLTRWREGYRLVLMEGDAVPTEMVFRGNPLRVRFPCPTNRIIDWIFSEGIGHHWMACYGHVSDPIRHWARLVGPELLFVEPPA